DIADYYRQRDMAAVVFGVDIMGDKNRDARSSRAPSNEEVAELAAENADVLIPFASIDPARGADGVTMARELITGHGVKGFKLHPSAQGFYPNDPSVYPLYEVIAEHRLIALFHTGHTGVGAGTRGGGGIRLKYANPMYIDDVAVDFPDMPIILAHPSFPWQDEALSVALHKPQVYIDLSGWSPKYFPPQLVQYANTLLKDKVLFGSDFPMITPDRWLADFEKIDIKPSVRPLILKDNAVRLFGLESKPAEKPDEEPD
ncbi:MAG TPA: amidohydrolase family protein, partial [Streptosporangiaceae bacterium]|nr:amidohydrolase family protein [Streptosporangiaceae bacterium]